jgi:hypothetical protein
MSKDEQSYDTAETMAILAVACETIAPDMAAAAKASRALYDQIARLGSSLPAGLEIKPEGDLGIAFRRTSRGQRPLALHLQNPQGSSDLHIVDHPRERYIKIHSLRFDPIVQRLEGTAYDSFAEPTPGKPRLKRSAMAVVVEQVLANLEAKIAADDKGGDWNI